MFLAGSYGYDHFGKTMRSKISLKRSLFTAGIVAIVFYIIILFLSPVLHDRLSFAKTTLQASSQVPQDQTEVASAESIAVAPQAGPAIPIRLKIPSINLDAPIEPVGLKANGEMDVPKGPDNVAWFNLGPPPGQIGSAVMAGHFGALKNGEGSVFDNLKKLKKDDKIYIENNKGATLTFVVREDRSYDADADASDVFSSNDGKAHLNLVTCQGWDKDAESYTKRFVVFTDKE
jgi:LPXTG-site transpeptidase (sortase) family protein